MSPRLRVLLVASTLSAGLAGGGGLALTTPAAAAAAPTCASVSPTIVHASLGGHALSSPSSSTSSNSFDGYQQALLRCTYSATVSISFSTPATTADFNLALKTLKNVAGAKTVPGIGNGAFDGTGSNSVCTTKCTTVKTENLWVLVTGKSFFEISASGVSLTNEKSLAKRIVPLV